METRDLWLQKEVQDGKPVYFSGTEVTLPIVLKTEDRNYVKRDVTASIIHADEVNFLCRKETTKGWKTKVDLEDN